MYPSLYLVRCWLNRSSLSLVAFQDNSNVHCCVNNLTDARPGNNPFPHSTSLFRLVYNLYYSISVSDVEVFLTGSTSSGGGFFDDDVDEDEDAAEIKQTSKTDKLGMSQMLDIPATTTYPLRLPIHVYF